MNCCKEKDDGEVEMEVYGQGTLKMELCNKWEHGVCPYDGRCRFAHGMEELCLVIRHPRCRPSRASCSLLPPTAAGAEPRICFFIIREGQPY